MVKNFYFFRNGHTDWNKENRILGQSDIPLNETGRIQAKELASMLADKIDLIISSPLKRTLETAEIVNVRMGLPIRVDERLMEIDCGEIEGYKLRDIYNEYGETRIRNFLSRYDEQSLNIGLPGGETKRAALARTINALLDMAMTERAQKIGVSSHGLIMTMLASYAGCEKPPVLANGDIVRIMYTNKKGLVSKGTWQFVEHIPNPHVTKTILN